MKIAGSRTSGVAGAAPDRIEDDSRSQRSFSTVRLVGMSVFFCMMPLALLTYLTIDLADRAVVREVDARVRTTSAVSALLVQEQMQTVARLTASYATRPILVKAMGDGDPRTFESDTINQQLAQLTASQPGLSGAFLTDVDCRLTQVVPATPAIVGVDFSFRDWCRGVRTTDQPYVSEAYRTAILGEPLVVAAAATVRATTPDQAGKPLGIVAVVYRLDAIRDFADQLARVQGIRLVITDQRGSVLVGTAAAADAGGLTSATGDPRTAAALRGQSGTTRFSGANGDMLSAYAPVEGVGWTVTAEVPAQEALSGVRELQATVLSVAGGLALVLTIGTVVLARALRQRRAAQRDLAAARDQAIDMSKLKSDFLATMSHEIRTPMNGVIGLTGLLLDSQLSETQRHHAEGVRASGEALLGISNDLRDFSKSEAGKLELETVDFDLTHALEDVAALVAESARAKHLELVAYCHPDVPTALRGDVGRIRQILLNFATNAVKFTAAGEVVLRAGLDEGSSAGRVTVRFEVVDTGVGLDTTSERLFEPFSQADASTTRRYGGTGLGLAICRSLAEAMGGSVGVDSQPGHGSTFWLRLPLAEASEPIAVPDTAAHTLEGRRVLVVDDNQTNRLVLASQLLAWDIR
ncbi:MAG: ATP-binding protein, partial [Acidimicrobiales bacterium]